jgi:hypothetical protein
LFGKVNTKNWKCEYEDTVYKIYDWNNNLAGYYYPKYNANTKNESQGEEIIIKMKEDKMEVKGGHLMVPMLKLDLLDVEYIQLDKTILQLEKSVNRAIEWKSWITNNMSKFYINDHFVSTSREDRNMLAIILEINQRTILDEKEILSSITPLLNQLNNDGFL